MSHRRVRVSRGGDLGDLEGAGMSFRDKSSSLAEGQDTYLLE
jgi:hypothetical protein